MLKKLYSNDGLSKQFAILVCIQPIIDIYRIFVGNKIEIASISLVELINIIFIAYLAVMFILNKRKLKSVIPPFLYGIVLMLYLILHCYNMLQFDTSIIRGTAVNVIIEIYVIVRAYVLPVMLLYMMICIRTKKQRFIKTTCLVSNFISIVIVVTNLLKVSFISYASNLEKNEFIRQNVIEWFTKQSPEDLNLITSKGWFYSGNQIGLILLMLFPFVVYKAIQEQKTRTYMLVLAQVVAMIMVSTKTAAMGSLLVLGVMMLLVIVFGICEKQWKSMLRNLIVLGLILGGGVGLLAESPVVEMMRRQEFSYERSNEEDDLDDELEELGELGDYDREKFIKFMNRYYYIYGVQEEYIDLLPVEKHTDFWFAVVLDESKRQIDFRDFKQRIYHLVAEENDNPKDPYLGIGYTTNFPYVEKDVSAQNVWFGIAGTVLLLGPYLLCFLYGILCILRDLKRNFNIYICTLGLSICAAAMVSLIAGHLFGYFFPIIVFTYIMAQFKHETSKVEE